MPKSRHVYLQKVYAPNSGVFYEVTNNDPANLTVLKIHDGESFATIRLLPEEAKALAEALIKSTEKKS